VGEHVDIAGTKDETAAQLERILSQFVLLMTARTGALPALEIVAPKNMKQVCAPQSCDFICFSLFINEQGKLDAGFFLKNSRIVAVPQADCCQGRTLLEKELLVFAQLRDVLAAENSSIVPKKHHDGGSMLPQSPQANLISTGVRENNACKL
jgi:hypothetical protein